ncbi:MAG: DUF3810 domain-containing protein [Bacillota bacterium]|nr:DUF3810 domain-containing protein [Bacillota bacterium]
MILRPGIRRLGRGWWLLPPLLAWLVLELFRRRPELAEAYAADVRPILIAPLRVLANLVPFSIAQILLAALIPAVLAGLLSLLPRLTRPAGLLPALGRRLRVLAILLSLSLTLYLVFHAWNYERLPLASRLGWEVRRHDAAELYRAACYVRDEAIRVRAELPEDEDGAMAARAGESQSAELGRAFAGWERLGEMFPELATAPVRPKLVLFSHYWSYTGITGMFMPLTAEANVNVDARVDERLAVALHEIAHVAGYAREDEANALAFLAGIHHPDADYRYSGWLLAFVHMSSRLSSADNELWLELWDPVPAGMRADIGRRNAYWKSFEGPVQETTTRVNDQVLKVNRQHDGVRSYGRMVDLVLTWYETVKPDA